MFLPNVYVRENLMSALSLAWATGVHNGKQPDSTAYEKKEAVVHQSDIQHIIYVSKSQECPSVWAHGDWEESKVTLQLMEDLR